MPSDVLHVPQARTRLGAVPGQIGEESDTHLNFSTSTGTSPRISIKTKLDNV